MCVYRAGRVQGGGWKRKQGSGERKGLEFFEHLQRARL